MAAALYTRIGCFCRVMGANIGPDENWLVSSRALARLQQIPHHRLILLFVQQPLLRSLGEFVPALRHRYEQVLRARGPGELRCADALGGVLPVSFRSSHEATEEPTLDLSRSRSATTDQSLLPEAMPDPLQHLASRARFLVAIVASRSRRAATRGSPGRTSLPAGRAVCLRLCRRRHRLDLNPMPC